MIFRESGLCEGNVFEKKLQTIIEGEMKTRICKGRNKFVRAS